MNDKKLSKDRSQKEDLGDDVVFLHGSAIAKDNRIEFAFWRGKAPATSAERNAAKKRGLEELQVFADGEQPLDEQGRQLHQALNKRSARIKLTIVTIEPSNETASFAGAMRQLDKFLPPSRDRFLSHALSHLGDLRPEAGQFGPMYSLCHALVKAREEAGGSLGTVHEAALAEIRANQTSPAGKALRAAERKLAELDHAGAAEKPDREALHYDKRVRDDRSAASCR